MSGSRRAKRSVDEAYGGLRLRCPAGHKVGFAMLQQGRYTTWTPHGAILDETSKIHVVCHRCTAAGRRLDLQASGSKIRALLDELESDITSGVADYTMGGNAIH